MGISVEVERFDGFDDGSFGFFLFFGFALDIGLSLRERESLSFLLGDERLSCCCCCWVTCLLGFWVLGMSISKGSTKGLKGQKVFWIKDLGKMTLDSKVGHLKVGTSTLKSVDGQVDLKVKG
jgi:hypothetical protein